MLLAQLIDIYCLIVVAVVVVSWTQIPRHHPVVRLLHAVTEPILGPARRIVPAMGGIDFSPLVVIVLLRLVAGMFT